MSKVWLLVYVVFCSVVSTIHRYPPLSGIYPTSQIQVSLLNMKFEDASQMKQLLAAVQLVQAILHSNII